MDIDSVDLEYETDKCGLVSNSVMEFGGIEDFVELNHSLSQPAGSCKKAPSIQAINPKEVHRICSGQVIVTLSTAVKELVENSIDAGATNIEIRLIESGSKLIEICDNGSGVEKNNLEGLTLKHHTSKITDFHDLSSIGTFGFRGEALSSLCALAKLTVVTKSENSNETAYRVKYDAKGKITQKTICAREKGTTVILEDLFEPLPVRQKEFHKNLKREFHKMVNILYGYCLISNGIRISCTNQSENGSCSKILSIPALSTMRDRIMTLFGPKQMTTLLEVKQAENVPEEILEEFGLLQKVFNSNKYTLEGYISAPNKGRGSNDRQFYWINSRPCEPAKISRLINEIYHGFSRNQSPFVSLHIRTNQSEIDVNVTPDKRVIYLESEKILMATVKATLVSLFSRASSNFSSSYQQMVALSKCALGASSETSEGSSCTVSGSSFDGNDVSTFAEGNLLSCSLQEKITGSKIKDLLQKFANNSCSKVNNSSSVSPLSSQRSSQTSRANRGKKLLLRSSNSNSLCHPFYNSKLTNSNCTVEAQNIEIATQNVACDEQEMYESQDCEEYNDSPFFGEHSCSQKENEYVESGGDKNLSFESVNNSIEYVQINESQMIVYDDDFDDDFNPNTKSVSVTLNWQKIKEKLQTNIEEVSNKCYSRKFRAKITPNENDSAEEELKKQITKDMFSKMKIIGQFNLGFIVVKSGPDMFIVDQHASDEKYNYETLEKSTVLTGQVLIR